MSQLMCQLTVLLEGHMPAVTVQRKSCHNKSLTCLEPQQGLTLFKYYFLIPKLQYLLRASPAYIYRAALHDFDKLIQSNLCQITNVGINEKSWNQASLSFRYGGLGLR